MDNKHQHAADAVAALTALARGTRTVGAGTPAAHKEPDDFADWLTIVLVEVAQNVGGIDALLAGRPGSWEAAHLRDWLIAAGADHERTEK